MGCFTSRISPDAEKLAADALLAFSTADPIDELQKDDLSTHQRKLNERLDLLIDRQVNVNLPWLSNDVDFDPPYPLELLLSDVSQEDIERLVRAAHDKPVIGGLDPFTKILYDQLRKAGPKTSAVDTSVTVGVAAGVADNTRSEDYPRKTLQKQRLLGFNLPLASEEVTTGRWQATMRFLTDELSSWLLSEQLPLYDELSAPRFFDSNYEAAIYFMATMRHFMPRPSDMAYLNKAQMLHGDVAALAFSGLGQWFLKGITEGQWPEREASAACSPPANAVYVIDTCHMAAYEMRPGYERYGAAVFFDASRKACGVWVEADGTLVTPLPDGADGEGGDEWQYALWRFKVSLYFLAFGPLHLIDCHWITANSLATALREQLEPSHPMRRLAWPFCFGAITINHAAVIKLAEKGGGLERISSLQAGEERKWIADLTAAWRYQTFEEGLAASHLSEAQLSSLPMVNDGRVFWRLLEATFDALLALEYLPDDPIEDETSGAADGVPPQFAPFVSQAAMSQIAMSPQAVASGVPFTQSASTLDIEELRAYLAAAARRRVSDDPQLIAFWASANVAARGEEAPLGLPPLSRRALRDYLVHAVFHSTAVHELMGNILVDVTVPTNTSVRILPKGAFAGRPPQATIQDWFRIVAVTASTTTLPVPKLVPEMRRQAELREASGHASDGLAARILRVFADALDAQARSISELNASWETLSAAVGGIPRALWPFGKFDPRRLEASVSL